MREYAKDKRSMIETEITSNSQSVPYTMVIVKRRKKRKKQNRADYLKPEEEFIGFATNRPDMDVKICQQVGDRDCLLNGGGKAKDG